MTGPTCLRAKRWAAYRALRPWQVHSEILAVAGGVYIARGVMLLGEDTATSNAVPHLSRTIAPLSAWGGLFIAVGVLALISSRWPPQSKTWGYAALAGLAFWWAFAYAASVVLGGPGSGLGGALIWGLVAYIWRRVSVLVNPDDVTALLNAQNPVEPPKGR